MNHHARKEIHTVPAWPRGNLRITEEADEERFRFSTRYRGKTYLAESDRFETALQELIAQLPEGRSPAICAACRLAAVDPFSAADLRYDISCFRRQPGLLEEYRRKGRHARPEFFQYLGKDPVDAFFWCAAFTPALTGAKENGEE